MKRLNEIFDITYGTKLDKNKTIERKNNPILFVSRTSKNHGIDLICEKQIGLTPNKAETISVPLGGEGRLTANVQFSEYYNGQNVAILSPKNPSMTLNQRIFYSIVIKKNQFKYSAFGREANSTLGDILVPDLDEIPDFVNKDFSLSAVPKRGNQVNDRVKFETRNLLTLFDVITGGFISEEDAKKCPPGDISFVSSGRFNNGVKAKVSLIGMETTIYPPNCLTLAKNGSVGVVFFHEGPIVTTTDVLTLRFKDSNKVLNKYEGLYFKVMIEKHIFRFNYGRKINESRLNEIKIRIPVTEDGKVDFLYINKFIKSMPFANLI